MHLDLEAEQVTVEGDRRLHVVDDVAHVRHAGQRTGRAAVAAAKSLARRNLPSMQRAGTAPRPLPRGPHNLTRDDVLASQRQRMTDAMAEVVAEKGYASTTVGDVVAGAGVSRKTFYEHFRDKEECFLAAFDAGVEALLAAIVAAEPAGPGWVPLLRARVRAYLVTLASRPEFARTFLIEV